LCTINSQKKYLVVIAGATGVGKTALAIELAKHYHSVILSADSRQFYAEMNIGTAKPSEAQLKEVQHFFVGNKSVMELYGAGHFEKDAIKTLEELFKKHNLIFLVGGSGLYIDAVLNGVDEFNETPAEIREQINSEYKKKGLAWLQEEVKKIDRAFFENADVQNPQRLIRAFEVFKHSGLPYSSFLNKKKIERSFIPIKILVNTPREKLYKQINERVDQMINAGLLEEVKSLKSIQHLNALKTVGYKELFEYLNGKMTLELAIDKIKQHTRNYAKRQLTWFKNKDVFVEFEVGDLNSITNYIDKVVSENGKES
jgi:tRNA dimethylallyltransferase